MFPDHSSTSYEIENKESKQIMTTSHRENRDSKVEERLRSVVLKLAETESNTSLFQTMTREGVATNEVRSFIKKQLDMKRVELIETP